MAVWKFMGLSSKLLVVLLCAAALAACGGFRMVPDQTLWPQNRGTHIGTAAWIDAARHGQRTANGERYDARMLVAAHPDLPMPSYARVDNLETGRSLVVRINDRMSPRGGRIIAVSRRSAQLLGFARAGLARVDVVPLGAAPRVGDQWFERRFLAAQPWSNCRTVGAMEAVDCRPVDAEVAAPPRYRLAVLPPFPQPDWPDR
jgi:rare lipoprotein A (peptidoglycan hydrolase)